MEAKLDGRDSTGAQAVLRAPTLPVEEPMQVVGFRVGEEEFGLDILRVQEIIRPQPLTRVPNSPAFINGVMNLRGRIIPVIALRQRFGLEPVVHATDTRIIVVEIKGTVLGFLVDSVSEVIRMPADMIEPPPRFGRVERDYVSAVAKIGDRLLILLDVDRLVSSSENLMGAAR